MKRVISLVIGNAALFSFLALSAVSTNAADSKGAWSVAAQMPTARTEIVADAFNGKIYVAGGQTPTVQDSPLFQEFDPANAVAGAISRRCREARRIPALLR